MRILVGNDDGVFAPGIRALANALATAGHNVTVVCPDRERSATGHGLTMHRPLRAESVHDLFLPIVKAWACSGLPADCIKLALDALLDQPPDLLLSGINQGANLGTDILYSGTVSAAMEGAIAEIPSIALSLTSFTYPDFQAAAAYAVSLVEQLGVQPLPEPMLLNINIPAIPATEIAGVKTTRQGIRRYHDLFEKRSDPRGKTYYWLSGEVLEETDAPVIYPQDEGLLTDVEAIAQNFISVTPLQYNLTYYRRIEHIQSWLTPYLSDEINV
jgi:5'-nucleotidase